MSPAGLAARRRAEQVAARRARLLGVALLLVLAAGATAGLVWAWGSGVLDTRTVVVGHERTSADLVDERLADVSGTPLVLVDPEEVEARVAELPLVQSARVERRWPRTLVVELAERQPAAAVAPPGWLGDPAGEGEGDGEGDGAAGGELQLVDSEGVVLDVLADGDEPPPGVPVVAVDLAAEDAVASLAAGRAAAEALPEGLRSRTTSLEARTPHDVRLVVDGRDVRWGGPGEGEAKVAVLLVLLDQVDAEVYDVSAPAAPAARGQAPPDGDEGGQPG